jgi:hypothetical protein
MELSYINTLQQNRGGFNYDNCLRNTAIMAQSKVGPVVKTMKTGTTICGIIFNVSGRTCNLTLKGRCCARC